MNGPFVQFSAEFWQNGAMSVHYVGSGPYCYANSLRMVLGAGAPDPSAIEVLTGSPFGMHVNKNSLAWFDPLGPPAGV